MPSFNWSQSEVCGWLPSTKYPIPDVMSKLWNLVLFTSPVHWKRSIEAAKSSRAFVLLYVKFNGYVLMGVLHLIVPSDYLFIADKSFNLHMNFIICYLIRRYIETKVFTVPSLGSLQKVVGFSDCVVLCRVTQFPDRYQTY